MDLTWLHTGQGNHQFQFSIRLFVSDGKEKVLKTLSNEQVNKAEDYFGIRKDKLNVDLKKLSLELWTVPKAHMHSSHAVCANALK